MSQGIPIRGRRTLLPEAGRKDSRIEHAPCDKQLSQFARQTYLSPKGGLHIQLADPALGEQQAAQALGPRTTGGKVGLRNSVALDPAFRIRPTPAQRRRKRHFGGKRATGRAQARVQGPIVGEGFEVGAVGKERVVR